MAYAFIHGEVKGSGASVEFKGNGLDLLDLTIQIVGSVVAEVPEPLRPYVIKVTIGTADRMLKLNQYASSEADAKRQLQAAIHPAAAQTRKATIA